MGKTSQWVGVNAQSKLQKPVCRDQGFLVKVAQLEGRYHRIEHVLPCTEREGEEGREGERERGREGGREGGRERGREGGREGDIIISQSQVYAHFSL